MKQQLLVKKLVKDGQILVMINYGCAKKMEIKLVFSKVNQIAIQEDARRIERGKALIDAGMKHGQSRGIQDFACGCADDLASNQFWKGVGWKQLGDRKGISHKNTWKETSKRKVNIYHFQQNSLFF